MGKNKGLKPQKDHVAVFSADYDSSVKIQGQGGESYLEIANHHNKTGDKKNSWGIGTNDDSKLHFSYGANGTMNKSDKIVINKAGHVGIGTSNPDTRNGWNKVLEVQGGPHAKTLVTTRNNKVKMGTYAHQNWGGPSGSVGTESNHDLRLLTNYNEKMRIKKNGNVGIGTSNPSEKLQVNGSIMAKEFKLEDGTSLTSAPEESSSKNSHNTYSFGKGNEKLHVGKMGHGSWAGIGHASVTNNANNSKQNYALIQKNDGTTIVNSKSGKKLHFRQNNSDKMVINTN